MDPRFQEHVDTPTRRCVYTGENIDSELTMAMTEVYKLPVLWNTEGLDARSLSQLSHCYAADELKNSSSASNV